MLPLPSLDCIPMQVKIPTINCEKLREEQCVSSLKKDQVEAKQCTMVDRNVESIEHLLMMSESDTFYQDVAGPISLW